MSVSHDPFVGFSPMYPRVRHEKGVQFHILHLRNSFPPPASRTSLCGLICIFFIGGLRLVWFKSRGVEVK
ncbi:Hypothetical protein NTJ_13052 [Nesidiocoris tenuis]|uniref:Uncharacterized protein n=1 Tax=Nesidiocoris tenuis TaxID=355587 RepID=A0ABN7B758_9HEMI|nr:Hypothetical protein NTJ_13052 [Nesidiocoris tenuis]